MEIEITLRGESKLTMPIKWIIADINQQPLHMRFACLGKMFDNILLNDIQNCTPEQKAIIIDFLTRHRDMFTTWQPKKIRPMESIIIWVKKWHTRTIGRIITSPSWRKFATCAFNYLKTIFTILKTKK